MKQIILHGCELGNHTLKRIHEDDSPSDAETSTALEIAELLAVRVGDERVDIYVFGDSMALHKYGNTLYAIAPSQDPGAVDGAR